MSAPVIISAPTLDEEVLHLQSEVERLRAALQRINARCTDMLEDLPLSKQVPHVLAAGHVLTLQGIAAAALEE